MADTQQQAPQAKWSGKATSAELKGLKADQIWPLWADFSNLHNWFPKLDMCRLVEGEPGRVGSVRLCVGKAAAAEEEEAMWVKERLVEMDEEKRLMRYEVMENNVGLKGYVAAITVLEVEGGGGCRVEWSFEAEAVEGWEEEALKGYIESSLESIVKTMEEALLSHEL
ncbi:unnamed protein product [Rhodiola kirilowii]